MGDGRDPFACEANVGACLLCESFSHSWRVEQRPFELVGEELVLKIDVQGDDAAVGVVRVQDVGCLGLRGGSGGVGRGFIGVVQYPIGLSMSIGAVGCRRPGAGLVSWIAGPDRSRGGSVVGGCAGRMKQRVQCHTSIFFQLLPYLLADL